MTDDRVAAQVRREMPALASATYVVTGGRIAWLGGVEALVGGGAPAPTTVDEWLAHVVAEDRARVQAGLARGGATPQACFYRFQRDDGVRIDVAEVTHANADGTRHGFVTDCSPLVERRILSERAQQRLRDVERLGHVGYFEYDLGDRTLSCSDGVYAILGADPRGATLTAAMVAPRLDPAGLAALRALAAARDPGARTTRCLRLEATAFSGAALVLEVDVEVAASGTERATVVGTIRDVTVQHAAERALRRSETLQQHVLAQLPLTVASFDRDGRVIAVAGRTPPLPRGSLSELVGTTRDQLAVSFPKARAPIGRALAGEATTERVEESDRAFHIHWYPVHAADGSVEGAGCVALELTAYEQVEREARGAAEHFRTIAENVDAVVWSSTPDLDHVYYLSPAFERVYGVPVAEVAADPRRWGELIHPEDRARVIAAATKCPWHQDQEHRIVRPDGAIRTIQVRVRPVRDASGAVVRAIGIAEDVTAERDAVEALRRSLAEKEALLREVHHRVHNNLQLVQSLLQLQERAVPDPAARRVLRDSQRRIQALALVQDSLYRSELHDVDLRTYLHRVLDAVGAAYRDGQVALLVVNEAVGTIAAQTAIHVGIAVTELVANAFEHGYPGDRRGTVRVGIGCDGGVLRVDVADDGVGLPAGFSPERATSLGLTLVASLVRGAGGTLEVVPQAGARFRLSLPLPPS